MSYVLTKRQLLRFNAMSPNAAKLAVKHFSGSLNKLSESAKDILIDSGLFALRGDRLVSLVRTYSAVGGGASVVESKPRRKPIREPAENIAKMFCRLYKAKFRQKYVVTKADLAQLRRVARELPADEVEARMLAYFEDHHRHPATIRNFVSRINSIQAAAYPTEEDSDEW